MGRRNSRRAAVPAGAGSEEPEADEPAPSGVAPLAAFLWVVAVGAFVLLSLVLYSASLRGPFVFDDVLLLDTYLRGDLRSQLDAIFSWGALRRVPRLTFSLQYALHGTETYGYHLVN